MMIYQNFDAFKHVILQLILVLFTIVFCWIFLQCCLSLHLTQLGCCVAWHRMKAKIWNTKIWKQNISLDADVESFRKQDLMMIFRFEIYFFSEINMLVYIL